MAENVTFAPLASIQNDTTAVATINANFQLAANAFADCLSRIGTQPNSMSSSLDMNSNQILNLSAPATLSSPVRLQDVVSPSILLNIPSLSGNNTWTGLQTFTSTITLPGLSIPIFTTSAAISSASGGTTPTLGTSGPIGTSVPTKWLTINDHGTIRYFPVW